ncbi:uncharacterized protein LOC106013918 [Aplysia californica]|uniref:Uncharacterized protein LOC106013918 n=1 Tax=Aplysia californica TaxID=6500 RepID=A0ABM1AEP4_APLCA|nr:uncharacterized protein LOC106013918 [Aplysia californica]
MAAVDTAHLASREQLVFTNNETAYLASTVAKPLAQCLQEVVEKRPRDPIEYIAQWLYKYCDNELYYMEKALFLKELHDMHHQLLKEEALKKANMEKLRAETHGMKVSLGEASAADGEGTHQLLPGSFAVMTHSRSGGSSATSSRPGSGRKRFETGVATWGVNCRLGLICQHPVLGDMLPRPALIYPETPEWWERQGYLPETLYDHEVYSRLNDDTLPNWGAIDHMTYKDFVEAGPWLTQANLQNMQASLQDMVRMPKKFQKFIRPPRPDDFFPQSAKKQKAELLKAAQDEAAESTSLEGVGSTQEGAEPTQEGAEPAQEGVGPVPDEGEGPMD